MMTEPATEPSTESPPPARSAPQRVWSATEWVRRTQRFTKEEDDLLKVFCARRNQPINDAVRELVMEGIERAEKREARG